MSHVRASGSATALALAVGIVALVIAVGEVLVRYTPETWIQRDGRFYVNVNTTIVEELSVEQDEFAASWYGGTLGWNRNLDAGWSNLALGRDDRRYPKHPILLPLLATPLFWAFGLHGALMFNLLALATAGGAAFLIARRYGSIAAAGFAALALILGTGLRDHAYDYHVDVLILALFTSGMAAALARRGLSAGFLIGLAVVARPTMLLWVPSLALLMLEARAHRALGRAMIGGAIPLALFALSNHWLYGAPWWSGYNRVLVVVAGVPQVADVSDAFSVPLEDGLRVLWEGPYGVRTRLTLMFAAAPGLLVLLRRRPLYVLAAVLGVGASVLLFAQYRWYGDRFLWPSCVLLVPALAATFEVVGRHLFARVPEWRAPLLAALGAAAILGAFAVVGPPIEQRFAGGYQDLGLSLLGAALIAFGLTRAAGRVTASPLAVLAPIAFVLLPGVRERLLVLGPDVWLCAWLCLALGARHFVAALIFAGLAAWSVAADSAIAPPASLELTTPAARPALMLLVLALAGAPLMGRHAALLAPLALLAIPSVAGLGDGRWPLFAIALLCLPLVTLALRVSVYVHDTLRGTRALGRGLVVATPLVALLITGVVARAGEEPFRIATPRAVRTAVVHLGDIPCDFLAWEHLNWECATFDRGVHGQTGLATSQPLTVGGEEAGLFLVSTQHGRSRTVRWDDVEADARLRLRYAVPDGLRGGGTMVIRIDDEELETIALPARPDGQVYERSLDTSAYAGRPVALTLELRGPGVAVGVDGGFGSAE